MEPLLVAVVVTALVFDYTNGFHDAANAVATSISTRAVPPNVALFAAAVLNVVGALVSTHVAATLAKGIVAPESITQPVMLGGLGSALGPLAAGIVIGVSEAVTMAFASPSWAPIVSFTLLILLLLLRPERT